MKIKKHLPWIIILLISLFFRIYKIDFGLPHTIHADEARFVEHAIRYTSEAKNIFQEGNFYKLIPESFVYGTFPTYILWVATMFLTKTYHLFGKTISATDVYAFLRFIQAVFSLSVIPFGAGIYHKLFKDKFGTIITGILLALNWKLIVHAHYINGDSIITALILGALYFVISLEKNKRRNLLLSGILFSAAVGTKITVLLTAPLFLLITFKKIGWRGSTMFVLLIGLVFMVTNPFSLIFGSDFFLRIMEMVTKEGGMVFDSVDLSPYKYISALTFMSTPLIFIFSIFGMGKSIKKREKLDWHILLIGHVIVYLAFFSIGSRKVDRWVLPILPIVLIYASYVLSQFRSKLPKNILFGLVFITLTAYVIFPGILLIQFQDLTPKGLAYKHVRDLDKEASILVITEDGQDPFNKLENAVVYQFSVYVIKGAHLETPPKRDNYKYVVLSSRVMSNYKRVEVREKYPDYAEKWLSFEREIVQGDGFELNKEFSLIKPNLIPLSDVFVYENLNYNPNL